MEAVWLAATTYQHGDGSAPAATLTTVEGSSRGTAVHSLLDIRSADVPYDGNEAKLRAHIRKLNDIFERGPSPAELVALRCERVPALILVGFRPHPSGSTEFATAVKSLVALRHVDPPKPWGEGPENESLADEVLDELYRRDLISSTQREYFAGSCTRAEARAAHLSPDPVQRAAEIVYLFTSSDDERVHEAIRVAVTSQSTRKRITSKLMRELATALMLRALADDPSKVDQVRRYLRHAFGKSVQRGAWQSTGRSTEQLLKGSLVEVRASIANQATDEPGPSSLELAVRAAYPLVVSGRLNADRGSANNVQPDRRTPGEVLDAMRRSVQGIHQLGQALTDFANGVPIRAVDEDGEVRRLSNGSGDQPVNDIYLRNEYPPPGKTKAASPGDTPTDRFNNALGVFETALEALDQAFTSLAKVTGDDGQPLVETRGVEPRLTDSWRSRINHIEEDMIVWTSTYRRVHGTKVGLPVAEDRSGEAEDDDDPYRLNEEEDESVDSKMEPEAAE
jgi:hypothetical protein